MLLVYGLPFESVSVYCKHGINMLPEDCWETHYKLSLDLFSLGAEAEGFLGRVHRIEEYCNEVLKQTEKQETKGTNSLSAPTLSRVRDKLRVYAAPCLLHQPLHRRLFVPLARASGQGASPAPGAALAPRDHRPATKDGRAEAAGRWSHGASGED